MGPSPSVAAVRSAVRRVLGAEPDLIAPGATVLVACSGGPDSLALLDACVFESRDQPWRVVGATVDHGLQEGSAARAARVVEQMAAIGADETFTVRVRVSGEGRGPEAAAREARYAVLDQVADHVGASVVLLGHTLDDQAETVLLGLARGSGGRSIAGMRPGFDRYRRPLLDLRRADTEAACAARGLDPWHDPHNQDPRFTRSRVRHTVLPVLERELGPGVAETLARTAESLRLDTEALDGWAARELAVDGALEVTRLGDLPPAVRRRVLRAAAVAAGATDGELFHAHVLAMEELVTRWRGQRWIDLPGHLRARRAGGRIVFES